MRGLFGLGMIAGCLFSTGPYLIAADFDWPGWRGPNRDAWVDGFRPPEFWPKKLNRVWRVKVGTGYGTPLVAGDDLFQHAREGGEEVLWCLDRNSGAVKWRQSYAVPFKMGGGGERHGKGPKSCPVMADGRVFTLSITGILSAWDAGSGELLWRQDYSSRFKKGHPYWGASTSPIIDDNRVVVHFGTDDDGALIALDTQTGEQVWEAGRAGPDYSSPLLIDLGGVRQIVEWNQQSLVGIESATGKQLWEYPYPHIGHNQNMPTPVVHNGRILLGGENRGIRCLEPTHAGSIWTVHEHWHQDEVALDMSSLVINGDLLYGFSHYDSGRLFCLDPKTGDVLWLGPPRAGQNVMFLSLPGHVVAMINDGELQVIKATGDEYQPVAKYRVSEAQTWAPPVLLGDAILVKDHDTLSRWSMTEADSERDQ